MITTESATHASAISQRFPASRPTAARHRRWNIGMAVLSAAFLSACAGMPAFVEPGPQAAATPATRLAARPERMRATTARDILLEWGVSGLATKGRKESIASRAAEDSATPDYSASIQEIVANATCHSCEQKPYHQMVLHASNQHGVPSGLIHAVIQKESGYKPRVRSRKNARGLMQLTPGTARFVGVENSEQLYDPQTNINAGTAYLKYLMRTHDSFEQVIAAYNSGPGNVRKYKGVPPFSETRRYVRDVKKYYAATSREVL